MSLMEGLLGCLILESSRLIRIPSGYHPSKTVWSAERSIEKDQLRHQYKHSVWAMVNP